jgi:hypothetical protein
MKSKIFLSFALLGVVLATSCKKQIEEAYLNPNTPVKVEPVLLLPAIQYQMALNCQEDYMYIGTTAQVFGLRQIFGTAGLNTRDNTITRHEKHGWWTGVDNSGGIWRMHYWNLGQNVNKLIEWAAEKNYSDYIGVAKAIQAWSWQTLTDYHGEAILKEAFNTSQLAFKYDTQEEIYAYVRTLCAEAITELDKTATSDLAVGDAYMFGGDKNKWKKFVYGVLARNYGNLTNKSFFKADSAIFYADKAMQTTSEDCTYKYVGGVVSATNNYWGRFRANNINLRQSKYITDLMKGTSTGVFAGVDDPRRWYMLTTGTGADVDNMFGIEATKGETPLGTTQRPVNFFGSTLTPTVDTARFIFRDNAEFPLMTSTEMQFIKAEAAYRKGDKITALAAYRKGIEMHFNLLLDKYNVNIRAGRTITTATRDAFLANPAVVPTNANNLNLSMILQQKFIALWGHGVLQAWTDLRRFHYTDTEATTGRQVFEGFVLPNAVDIWNENGNKPSYRVRPRWNSEYVWNIAEIAKFGGDQVNYHTFECWFSKP